MLDKLRRLLSSSDSTKPVQKADLEQILGTEKLNSIERLIKDELSKPPKIAVIGKSGVGKTTTINNLFAADWEVSHTVAGTKKAKTEEFTLAGGGKLSVVDMPGLGEDIETDKEYEKVYREILPEVDVVIWIIQANARDLAEDQRLIGNLIAPIMKGVENRFIVGLNQVDKIGPGNWDERLNLPSVEQEANIEKRCKDIAGKLSGSTFVEAHKVVHYSALRRYRLYELLTAMIQSADNLGWKFPIQPKDPFELAAPEVRSYIETLRHNEQQ